MANKFTRPSWNVNIDLRSRVNFSPFVCRAIGLITGLLFWAAIFIRFRNHKTSSGKILRTQSASTFAFKHAHPRRLFIHRFDEAFMASRKSGNGSDNGLYISLFKMLYGSFQNWLKFSLSRQRNWLLLSY